MSKLIFIGDSVSGTYKSGGASLFFPSSYETGRFEEGNRSEVGDSLLNIPLKFSGIFQVDILFMNEYDLIKIQGNREKLEHDPTLLQYWIKPEVDFNQVIHFKSSTISDKFYGDTLMFSIETQLDSIWNNSVFGSQLKCSLLD
ncbi:hypothetical protein OAU52_00720 [bacterium]|nr:hypothetical protein [bacterium]